MKPSWSSRTRSKATGKRLLLKGTAYPNVAPGSGATRKIKADKNDRHSYYHDPAVRLNEKNLDDIDGAQGAPICYKHDESDVVGMVTHSWLREDDQGRQPLEIIAELPLDDYGRCLNSRGVDVRREIEEKRIRGFSVRYTTKYGKDDMVNEKLFQEISLVPEPFFDGCNLTMSVVAGQNQGNNGKSIH